MSFYLFLPSNVNIRYFPNNRISCFQVKLPKRLKFEQNEYVVALTELSYIHSMKKYLRMTDRLVKYEIYDLANKHHVVKNHDFIPNINYSNINTVLREVNKLLHSEDGGVLGVFKYVSATKRVILSVNRGIVSISQKMAECLGYSSVDFDVGVHEADGPLDLSCGMYNIFIYSDIVQSQIVGDSLVPLLRIVSISGEVGQSINQTFRPYYLPISKTDFNTIEIMLCNEFGEEIQFEKGEAIVTLHFKKI